MYTAAKAGLTWGMFRSVCYRV